MILDKELNYNKKLISEMLHIHKQKQELNLQTDMDNLDRCIWICLWNRDASIFISWCRDGVEYYVFI